MFRPKVKAGLFFSLLVSAGLGLSQAAHAAEAPSNDVQQSSSSSVTVDSSSTGDQAGAAASISVDSKQTSFAGADSQVSNSDSHSVTGSDTATTAGPKDGSSDSTQKLGDEKATSSVPSDPTSLSNVGIVQVNPNPQPLAVRLKLAAQPVNSFGVEVAPSVTAQQKGIATQPPQPNKPSAPLPSDELQRLGAFFSVTLPLSFKGFSASLGSLVSSWQSSTSNLLFTFYLLGLILGGYTLLLRRSGFSHGARSDVPANGAWNFVTLRKVSYAWAVGPNVSSLFSGVNKR